jgi:hypothetical protein
VKPNTKGLSRQDKAKLLRLIELAIVDAGTMVGDGHSDTEDFGECSFHPFANGRKYPKGNPILIAVPAYTWRSNDSRVRDDGRVAMHLGYRAFRKRWMDAGLNVETLSLVKTESI